MKFTDYKCLESLLIVTEGIETPNDQIKNNIPLIKSITSKIIEQTKEKYKALQFNCVIKNSNNIVYFDVFRDQNILNENNEKYKEANKCINSLRLKLERAISNNSKLQINGFFLCLVEDTKNENRIMIRYER